MSDQKKINNVGCCVNGCYSRKSKNPELHFHNFPVKNKEIVYITSKIGSVKQVDRRELWEKLVLLNRSATKFMRVCSKHFKIEDYKVNPLIGGVSKVAPRLKNIAVPSLHLPERSLKKVGCKTRSKQQKHQHENLVDVTAEKSVQLYEEEVLDTDVIDEFINFSKTSTNDMCEQCDKSCQVTQNEIWLGIQTDSCLNSLSGIPNFKLFNTLCDLVKKNYPNDKTSIMSINNKVLLVFMKLKQNLTFKVLALFFNISSLFCTKVFQEYIKILANITKSFIVWPSIEECRQNIPISFTNFQNVRVIVDCIEIPINQPKCSCCQVRVKTYSHCKKRNVIKVMIGVSPGGLLTFVSNAYGADASDKFIFEESDIINLLEPHVDSIMVDKRFLVEEICNNHFIQIVRPPFLRNKKQFLKHKHNSRGIVQIENVNQRLRTFNILNTPMMWSLVRFIHDIIAVCAAMVNIQPPLFSDDEFL